jgi:aminoglycoside 3-N-acetyltransferase
MGEGFLESLPKRAVPFDPARTEIVRAMGAVPRALRELSGALRSGHPLVSFLAIGHAATELTSEHAWDAPHQPLERLAALGGYVLLSGVGLRSCTALHIAEMRAGRQPFIRWVLTANGSVRRVRVGGCSDGFDKLWPELRSHFRLETVGDAELASAPLSVLIEAGAELFRRAPERAVCRASCARCRDAALGGPAA